MSYLSGKVALITSGRKGTGLGIARAYVKQASQSRSPAAIRPPLTPPGPSSRHSPRRPGSWASHQRRLGVPHRVAIEDLTWDDMISSYESGVFTTWRFRTSRSGGWATPS